MSTEFLSSFIVLSSPKYNNRRDSGMRMLGLAYCKNSYCEGGACGAFNIYSYYY